MVMGSAENITIRNNIFLVGDDSGNYAVAIIFGNKSGWDYKPCRNIKVVGNTFVITDQDAGEYGHIFRILDFVNTKTKERPLEVEYSNHKGLLFKNNLIYSKIAPIMCKLPHRQEVIDAISSDYNLFHLTTCPDSTADLRFRIDNALMFDNPCNYRLYTLEQWQGVEGNALGLELENDLHIEHSNPELKDLYGPDGVFLNDGEFDGNLHLEDANPPNPPSPAKDKGIAMPDDLYYDRDGNVRGDPPDIGAYEYTGTPPILYGDVSENGEITSYDAALVAQHVVGIITLNAEQMVRADVSGNGSVTSFDAALIAQYVVGIIDEFPVEGGE